MDRKDAAGNWLKEKQTAWSEMVKQKKISMIEQILAIDKARSEAFQAKLERQLQELRGTAELRQELEQQIA